MPKEERAGITSRADADEFARAACSRSPQWVVAFTGETVDHFNPAAHEQLGAQAFHFPLKYFPPAHFEYLKACQGKRSGLEACWDMNGKEYEVTYVSYQKNGQDWVLVFGHEITKHVEQKNQLLHEVTVDGPTGLLNQRGLNVKIQRLDSRAHVGVIALDLDGFKEINETYGHGKADEVIAEAAKRIREAASRGAEVARRYSAGDEFVVVIPFPQTTLRRRLRKRLGDISVRILQNLAMPLPLEGVSSLKLTASIGIAHGKFPGKNFSDLLQKAETAQRFAKHNGKNRREFYHAGLKRWAKDLADQHDEHNTAG